MYRFHELCVQTKTNLFNSLTILFNNFNCTLHTKYLSNVRLIYIHAISNALWRPKDNYQLTLIKNLLYKILR